MIFDLPTVQMENLNISIGLDFFQVSTSNDKISARCINESGPII